MCNTRYNLTVVVDASGSQLQQDYTIEKSPRIFRVTRRSFWPQKLALERSFGLSVLQSLEISKWRLPLVPLF
jgi:hypothetical protein